VAGHQRRRPGRDGVPRGVPHAEPGHRRPLPGHVGDAPEDRPDRADADGLGGAEQQREQLLAGEAVERAGGLVGEDDLGRAVQRQGPGG
jgi:hypothetical protein